MPDAQTRVKPTEAKRPLFLRACRGEDVERTPIWVMRQAGRYLPEYREVRKKTSFLGLCKTPELAVEVTKQPIVRYGFDAAIIFSDILVPVEAMGVRLEFREGPVLPEPIGSVADVQRLSVPDPVTKMGFVLDAVRQFRAAMPSVPLIGFAGAPFTLASYLIEGGGSRDYARTKKLFYDEPKLADALLGKLAETVSAHLLAQVEAGAQAVQIFDSWAGHLCREDYLSFGLRYTIPIIDALKKKGVPVILFAKGVHACFDELRTSGADVLGVDWAMPLSEVAERTRDEVVLQGNLDPCVLLGPGDRIEEQVQRVLAQGARAKGHIFNLGHGILKMTPPESVSLLVEAVRRHGGRPVPRD